MSYVLGELQMSKGIRLFLVRHGNTFEEGQTSVQIGKRSDLPLTSVGRAQMEQFARYLQARDLRPTAVYCGSLSRQSVGATSIAAIAGGEVRALEPALDELEYGAWEGLTVEALQQQYPEPYRRWLEEAVWPTGIFGESEVARMSMLKAWLSAIATRHSPGELVVAVTSNGILRMFHSLLETSWQVLIAERRIKELQVKTGHFCELELVQLQLALRVWNVAPR